MYSISLISVSLCVFPDLTPENLSTVLDVMKDWLWESFSHCVNIPQSEIDKIMGQFYSLRECKQAVISHLISTHPCLSWTLVAHVLYQMVTLSSLSLSDDDDAVSCHSSLDLLQQKFPMGDTYCTQQQYGPTS